MTATDFIQNHKHINYCEAVIFPNGDIEAAEPSHCEFMIALYCSQNHCTRDDIWNRMDVSNSPIHWLVANTACVAVWYDYLLMPDEITDEQAETLAKLLTSKVICTERRVLI